MLPSTLIGGAAGQDWKSEGGIGGGGAGSGTVGGRGGEGGKGQSVASARSRSEAARRLPCWSPWLDDGAALANHMSAQRESAFGNPRKLLGFSSARF